MRDSAANLKALSYTQALRKAFKVEYWITVTLVAENTQSLPAAFKLANA